MLLCTLEEVSGSTCMLHSLKQTLFSPSILKQTVARRSHYASDCWPACGFFWCASWSWPKWGLESAGVSWSQLEQWIRDATSVLGWLSERQQRWSKVRLFSFLWRRLLRPHCFSTCAGLWILPSVCIRLQQGREYVKPQWIFDSFNIGTAREGDREREIPYMYSREGKEGTLKTKKD